MTGDLLTTRQVADEIKMSPRFVLDQLRAKKLRGAKFGGEWRVSAGDLRDYIAAHTNVRPVRKRDVA